MGDAKPANYFCPPSGRARVATYVYILPRPNIIRDLSLRINAVSADQSVSIVNVVGAPQSGKTELLRQWLEQAASNSIITLSLPDEREYSAVSTVEGNCWRFLKQFHTTVSKQIDNLPPIAHTDALATANEKFQTILLDRYKNTHLIVMLDQFEVVAEIGNPDFLQFVFSALHKVAGTSDTGTGRLTYIIVDRVTLDKRLKYKRFGADLWGDSLKEQLLAILGSTSTMRMPYMNGNEIQSFLRWARNDTGESALLGASAVQGTLQWTNSSWSAILRDTIGHPGLLSWLGYFAFEDMMQRNDSFCVYTGQVKETLLNNIDAFWQECIKANDVSAEEQRVLKRLAQKCAESEEACILDIFLPNEDSFRARLDTLEQKGVLDCPQKGQYCFSIPLFRDWIVRQ